ncbi:MAG: bifunctional folylpolyglutamate synthase/dihydrofolate synthase [Parabacteroides sp.]
MTYEETIYYLFHSIPVFQQRGASAYKPGLDTTIALDNQLANPHRSFRTIHVGGTNGKGSVSHLLAATLQQAGYRVGLFTSPHLVDFRERIRVNGKMISESYVVDFVARHRAFFEPLHPSFFELTTALAFDYFRNQSVDIAVIEVGLGGRLDCTNIITPLLSIITNISLDHTQFLGDTVEQIAAEKAGILKPHVPAVIGEVYKESVADVFRETARRVGAPLTFAQETEVLSAAHLGADGYWHLESRDYGPLVGELGGAMQDRNARTVLTALALLQTQLSIPQEAVRQAFRQVVELTGLMGRWQTLQKKPHVICDTGHNTGGWAYLSTQLEEATRHYRKLWMVVGMVNDKDISGVLALMPKQAHYLFTQAAIPRALAAEEFARQATAQGLEGCICPTVAEAVRKAQAQAGPDDLIFIGGSTFIVAEAIPLFHT